MQSKITAITGGKSGKIYNALLEDLIYKEPHLFIREAYSIYQSQYKGNPGINGRIFEYLVCETLAQEGFAPFYYQAVFERVPNAEFDVVLYNRNSPVVLTMKTSLRERYKQADLEGLALRQVYRKSATYLITLSKEESAVVNEKIDRGDISGLDGCIVARDLAYSHFMQKLKEKEFGKAEKILPLQGPLFSP